MPFEVRKSDVRIWESFGIAEVAPLHAELCRLTADDPVVDLTALTDIDLAGVQLLLCLRRSWRGLRFNPPKDEGLREMLRMWGIA